MSREIKEDLYEDFIYRLMLHIRRVQDNMIKLELNRDKIPLPLKKGELLHRGLKHDISKTSPECLEGYIACHEFYTNKRLGKPTSHVDMTEFHKAWKIHSREPHHPEGKDCMDYLDICEMVCDIVAMAQEFDEPYDQFYKEKMVKKFPILKKYNNDILEIIKVLKER